MSLMKIQRVRFATYVLPPGSTGRVDGISAHDGKDGKPVVAIDVQPDGLGVLVTKGGETDFYPWERVLQCRLVPAEEKKPRAVEEKKSA